MATQEIDWDLAWSLAEAILSPAVPDNATTGEILNRATYQTVSILPILPPRVVQSKWVGNDNRATTKQYLSSHPELCKVSGWVGNDNAPRIVGLLLKAII